jgi:DNA-binding winged helix-turn-helix (wHTH) protein/Flp pilus assembly protein TadD
LGAEAVNDAVRVATDGLLTTADLAARPDFTLGLAAVSPSSRSIAGPGGAADVEPRVMQVLVVLAEAAGQVVTRETLFQRCWGGVYVGDDSLNRAVGAVRKLASDIAGGSFEIETIPRTGYRLKGTAIVTGTAAEADHAPSGLSRRTLVGGVAAAAAIRGGAGLWWASGPQSDPKFDALMERGRNALRLDDPEASRYFRQAVALEPENAKGWGLLGYSLTDAGGRALTGPSAQAAERASRKALAIDPNESNALLAMTLIQSDTLDWYAREQRFRRILEIDPVNTEVLRCLGQLLHGVGRCREALAVVERALQLDPLNPDHWMRKAMRLWVLGRTAEADPVIDRAMELWPSNLVVRLGRLMIYAFTGRASAALAMIDDEQAKPIFVTKAAIPVWHASLAALDSPTPSSIAAARKANIEGAHGSPQIAAWAILALSALGEIDAAFEVANGFLLDRGSVIVRPRPDPRLPHIDKAGWRNTYGLFIPPTKAMRLDARFANLAQGLGLTDYWNRRGIRPDAFLFQR